MDSVQPRCGTRCGLEKTWWLAVSSGGTPSILLYAHSFCPSFTSSISKSGMSVTSLLLQAMPSLKKLCLHWIVNGFSSVTCRRSHYKWPKSLQSRGQYFVSLISSCFLFYMEKLAMLYNCLLKPVQVWLLFSTMFQYSNCFSLTPQTQLYFSCF